MSFELAMDANSDQSQPSIILADVDIEPAKPGSHETIIPQSSYVIKPSLEER